MSIYTPGASFQGAKLIRVGVPFSATLNRVQHHPLQGFGMLYGYNADIELMCFTDH